MSIERLGPIDPVSAYNKSSKSGRVEKPAQGDSILVSDEARVKAELLKVSQEVKNSSDVRLDRVDELKKKLEDPTYIDEVVLSKTADSIMEAFGL
ncbi:MAG: flagellar biosynthesis anti-sigma factor FlgM [Spirochaetales bacterium]|nr:flagellar biosynthesis anti-sigma factor FlgM [Spirochaetales bacterium]